MNIAIVDDLKTDSDRLVGFIDTYLEQHKLSCGTMDRFSSGEAFLSEFTSGKYDLIFLDIYMDGITGMETAKRNFRSTRSPTRNTRSARSLFILKTGRKWRSHEPERFLRSPAPIPMVF